MTQLKEEQLNSPHHPQPTPFRYLPYLKHPDPTQSPACPHPRFCPNEAIVPGVDAWISSILWLLRAVWERAHYHAAILVRWQALLVKANEPWWRPRVLRSVCKDFGEESHVHSVALVAQSSVYLSNALFVTSIWTHIARTYHVSACMRSQVTLSRRSIVASSDGLS